MNAGSFSGFVTSFRKVSATAGSGDDPLKGMCTKLMPAAFAAAASASTFAPGSLASRRLMMDLYPISFIVGTASGDVAPAQATVVSRRAKFVTPGTDGFVICCAQTEDEIMSVQASAADANGRLVVMECSSPTTGHLKSHTAQSHAGRVGRVGRVGHVGRVGRVGPHVAWVA